MYPNTQTKPHYRASTAALQLFLCAGTSCTCYTNVSTPFHSGRKWTASDKRLRTSRQFFYPFLPFCFWMCKFAVGRQKALAGTAPPASANKTCARKNICACMGPKHTCAHAQKDIQMAYLCPFWLWWIAGKHSWDSEFFSAQPLEPLMRQLLLQSSWKHEEEALMLMLTAAFFPL